MLVNAVLFSDVVVAIHVIAIVLCFGLVIVWPFVQFAVERSDQSAASALHSARQQVSRMIVNPALVLVLISGIYLASDLHQWKQFYVQWGLAMVVILGGIEGALVSRVSGKLAEVGAGSAESASLKAQVTWASRVMAVLVILTIYFMATHTS